MSPRYDLSFCTCTTACLASDLLVSMGPHPHLGFLIAKQCRLVQNYKSLWVPDLTCRFVHATGGILDPQRLVILVLKSLLCMNKTTGESWNQYSLFILVLSTLLCVLKITDEVRDPYRLVILIQKSMFCIQKGQMRAGTHRD